MKKKLDDSRDSRCKIKEILNNAEELFFNQDNCNDESYARACWFFINKYDFDIDGLPERLYDAVAEIRKKEAEESYWDDQAIIFMESQ